MKHIFLKVSKRQSPNFYIALNVHSIRFIIKPGRLIYFEKTNFYNKLKFSFDNWKSSQQAYLWKMLARN